MTKKEEDKGLLLTQAEKLAEIKRLMAELNEASQKEVVAQGEKDLEAKKTERETRVKTFFSGWMLPLEKFAHDLADDVLGGLDRKAMNLSAGYVSPKGVKCVMALSMTRDTGKKDTIGKGTSELESEAIEEFPDSESLAKAA